MTDEVEVLVCDDGSSDTTGAILDALARDEPRLRVLHRAANRGIEASIRTLYEAAQHPWVFLNSADLQWPMQALLPLAAAAAAGADLVIGVRPRKHEVYTRYRRALSRGYTLAVHLLGGAGAADPGSIKLGRRELLHRAVVAHGVFAEAERIVRATREGARIVEVDVGFRRRRAGRARGAAPALVVGAVLDVARVACSLAAGWPSPAVPTRDV